MKYLLMIVFATQLNWLSAQSVNFKGQMVTTSDVCNALGFQDNVEAKNALDKICDAAGLVNNYVLMPCPNIGTCLATSKDNIPMILYDNEFLSKIKSYGFSEKKITNNNSNNNVDWTSLTILAHELGHHVNQHFSKLRSGSDYILSNELEADEFAGKALYKLGATLEQTKAAYYSVSVEASFNHPSRSNRLQAIEKGYKSESSKYNLNTKSNNSSFLIGDWKMEGINVITFQSNGTFQSSSKGKFNIGFWNINNGKINLKANSTDPGKSISIQELTNYTLTFNDGKQVLTYIRSTENAKSNYDDYYNKNWKKIVSIGNFNFTSRGAGGIWDVNVPLINKSDRDIEYAQVSVEYIKDKVFASGAVYKTEYIEFVNIKARSTSVVKAPDSDRGVAIKTTITKIRFKN
jgi:hypothetical protein